MKRQYLVKALLALSLLVPLPVLAGVTVTINVPLPPPLFFPMPPEVVVIPNTYVYGVPDSEADVFFADGWWWRLWEGRWYRSRSYDSGWMFYESVPLFYVGVPSGWRSNYREHRWEGHPWNYHRIPHQEVQRNWKTWKKTNHWEKEQTWGVKGLKPAYRTNRPPQTVQPRPQARPEPRTEDRPRGVEPSKPRQAPPQSREVQAPRSGQEAHPPAKSKSREVQQPQSSRHAPQEMGPDRAHSESREPSRRADPHQGKPEREAQGKHGGGGGDEGGGRHQGGEGRQGGEGKQDKR